MKKPAGIFPTALLLGLDKLALDECLVANHPKLEEWCR
jgi:hypothetical protein